MASFVLEGNAPPRAYMPNITVQLIQQGWLIGIVLIIQY